MESASGQKTVGASRPAETPPASANGSGASASATRPPPAAVVVAPRTLVLFVAASLGGVLLLALAYTARGILVQLVVAIVLAMALDPLVQLLQRRGLRHGSAVGVAFTVALVAVGLFVYLLVPPLVDEVTRFAHNVPAAREVDRGDGRFGFLERRFHVVERARAAVAGPGSGHTLGSALTIAGRVFSTVGAIVTVAFLTLFVSLGGRAWFDGFLQVVPEGSRARWRRAGSGVSDAVGGYVGGNLLISVIAGTVTTLLLLATHVPYPVPLGILVAFFDLIPLVGATIGTVIVAAVALTKGIPTTASSWGMVIYQQVEPVSTLVYNRTVKLSPLASPERCRGAEIGGIVSTLLGIPFAGALKVVSVSCSTGARVLPVRTGLTHHKAGRSRYSASVSRMRARVVARGRSRPLVGAGLSSARQAGQVAPVHTAADPKCARGSLTGLSITSVASTKVKDGWSSEPATTLRRTRAVRLRSSLVIYPMTARRGRRM